MSIIKKILYNQKFIIIIYLLLGLVISFLSNYCASYFQTLIDRFSDQTLTSDVIIKYGVLLLSAGILEYADEYPSTLLASQIYLDLKIAALKKLRKIDYLDYLEYLKLGTGTLVQRIENGAKAGESIIYGFCFLLIRNIIPSIVFSLFFIYQIDLRVASVIIIGYLFVFFFSNILLKFLYHLKERVSESEELLNHYLVRGFTELTTFRINRRFKKEIAKAETEKTSIVSAKIKMKLIHEAFFAVFAILVILIKAGIIWYGWKTDLLTVGSAAALLVLVDNAYTPVAIFNVLYAECKLDIIPFRKYLNFLNKKEDPQINSGNTISQKLGDICFKNISFSYENRLIFHHITVKINQGQHLALAGESGSGKTTFVLLLTGLIKPDSGFITIGQNRLHETNLSDFYEKICYLPQIPPIFSGSLRENIVFDQSVEDSDILEVFEKVCLTDFYCRLDHGLDSLISEKGSNISGGERQRLALARLWFQPADLFILDESFSAIDPETRQLILEHLRIRLHSKTLLCISHDSDILKSFDQVLWFEYENPYFL